MVTRFFTEVNLLTAMAELEAAKLKDYDEQYKYMKKVKKFQTMVRVPPASARKTPPRQRLDEARKWWFSWRFLSVGKRGSRGMCGVITLSSPPARCSEKEGLGLREPRARG